MDRGWLHRHYHGSRNEVPLLALDHPGLSRRSNAFEATRGRAEKGASARFCALFLGGAALVSALTVMIPAPAAAQSTNWIGGESQRWAQSPNWDNGVPTTGITANINTISPEPTRIDTANQTSGNVIIGTTNGGAGRLTIQQGGTLSSSDFVRIGEAAGSNGEAIVTGAGSTWAITSSPTDVTLIVGNAGTGKLTISDLATVATNGGGMSVGNISGTGILNITSGGRLTIGGAGSIGGENAAIPGTGRVAVTGAGSLWSIDEDLTVSASGAGTLNIEDHGTVSVGSDAVVGVGASANGTLNIKSRGALTVAQDLTVGLFGIGTLTVSGQGRAEVGGTLGIANDAGSTGTLNIGAGTGDSAQAPGIVDAGAIQFGAGTGTVNFNHTSDDYVFTPIMSGPGAVNQIAGTTILPGDHTYTGDTTISGGTLQVNGSIMSDVTVNDGGTLGGTGTIFNNVTNFGTVAPGTSIGTLTIVDNYVGNGGTLEIETVLGGDNSPTDQLVINNGTATGSTSVDVTNFQNQGTGAQTNIGIPIIVAEGTTMDSTAFSLGGPVVAGLYQYQLYQGTPGGGGTADEEQSWYLRSTTNDPNPQPLHRPEASIYGLVPSMARALNVSAIGTFHERNGDQRLVRDNSPGWGRVFGNFREHSHSGTLSERFKGHAAGLQAGFDLARWELPDGSGHRAGVMFAYARAKGDVHGLALAQPDRFVGTLRLSSFNGGAYWNYIGPTGGYLDAVLMGSIYDGNGKSTNDIGISLDGWGATASLEAGYPIALGAGLVLEPQAQIIWQHVSLDGNDAFTDVDYDIPSSAWRGRLGARLAGDLTPWGWNVRPYLKANVIGDWAGSHDTIFANVHRIGTGKEVTLAEVGGGIAAQLTPSVGVWSAVAYSTEINGSDESREIWRGSAGLRVLW